MRGRRVSVSLLPGIAWAGVVLGHWVAYLLAVPSSRARDRLLEATGHAYWPMAVAAAVGLAVLCSAAFVVGRLRRGARHQPPTSSVAFGLWLLPRLSLLQVGVFVAQEALEHVLTRTPLSHLLHGDVLVVGVLVQLAVAALATLLLVWLGRAAEAAGRAFAPVATPSADTDPYPVRPGAFRPSRVLRGAYGSRAPPPLAFPTA